MINTKSRFFFFFLLILIISVSAVKNFANPESKSDPGQIDQVIKSLDALPLYFIENRGQVNECVSYYAKLPNGYVYLTSEEIKVENIQMRFLGRNERVKAEGVQECEAKVSFFRGNDPQEWVKGAPTYQKVLYRELYPRIDFVVSGSGERIKHEYRVKARGDTAKIRMRYEGIKQLSVNKEGDLKVETDEGILIKIEPLSYQIIDGEKVEVRTEYVLAEDNTVRFRIGDYRKDEVLIIESLIYPTFLGESDHEKDFRIAFDESGNAYVTGCTPAGNYQKDSGLYTQTPNGGSDIFITKLDSSGTQLVYSTYLVGSGYDYSEGIAVDESGNIYVAGGTESSDFPITPGAYNTNYNGGTTDAFVTKLNSTGTDLLYSTYFGSPYEDSFLGIEVDESGNAYANGYYGDPDFSTGSDPAIIKLNSTGTGLLYSTYSNGSQDDFSKEIAAAANGTTYYVRTDGGTGTQCTGTTDAAYPGSGTNQPCAWAHPFWALDSSGNWKIQGGDTIIIYPGSYMMGYGAPNTSGWCESDYAWDCHLPALPSGPSSNQPTTILGKGWDRGCSNPPELWGTQRPWQILNLTGTSNAYIGCLELTDHSGCIEDHANPAARCERDTYPFGDWAATGISASDSSNVTLKHLNIHGLAHSGIHAGRLSDWTVEDVRIAGNGWAGWDGDIYGDDSNSGTLTFKRWTVEWNGCAESYPDEQPNNCWAQTAGGYGDGVGTGATGGHWIIEDSTFRHNTSDGLDLLYVRSSGSQIDIERTKSYGNAGDQVKVNGPTKIENCLIVSNCGYFDGKSFTYHVDNCRAGGSTIALNLRKGNTISVINSTIAGHGDCLGIIECDDSTCDGTEKIILQNNIFLGYSDFLQPGDTTCYLWFDQDNFYTTQIDYNVIYNAKAMVLSSNDINQDPLLVNDNLESFDGNLQQGSPAIDSGLPVGSLNGLVPSVDITGGARPSGSGVDRGAYEYGAAQAPQISLSTTTLYFGAATSEDKTSDQQFAITNTGGGTLGWSISDDADWLSCSSPSGTGDAVVTASVDPTGLAAAAYSADATYTGTITVTDPNASNSPQTVSVTLTVYTAGGDSVPFGSFDTPVDLSTVSGSIPVTGWALDDIQVEKVEIKREPHADDPAAAIGADGLVWIGNGIFVKGARTDVEALYPSYPNNDKAGWGYMLLTYGLPQKGNGIFKLHAIAEDSSGNRVLLGIKTITSDNNSRVKPFGTIDTPTQGGVVSGANYVNFGWALTPVPKMIPTDGSTMNVYINSVNVGNPTYNQPRSDIANDYPTYLNKDGPAGYFYIDTTQYTNGVHTIGWDATDDEGAADGMGSRFFEIQNVGSSSAAVAGIESTKYVQDISGKLKIDVEGEKEIEIEELGRIELKLKGEGGSRFVGWGENKSKPLPIGSTLDRENGIFYWMPGPGFLKKHILHFAVTDGVYMSKPVKVIVNIISKTYRKYGEKRKRKN